MFEESLVESTAMLANRNRWPAVASISLQALLLGGLLAVPVLHPEVLPLRAASLSFIPPAPKPPAPRTPPSQRVHVETTNIASFTAPPMLGTRLPSHPFTSEGPLGLPTTNTFSMTDGGPSLPFAAAESGGGSSTRVVRAADPGPAKLQRISSGVSSGLLLEPIRPIYPIIAKTTRTEGTVVISAIISRTGHIESARVQSGHPLLQAAALEAVRAARYRPYLLNGEPTEVETTISINFHLGS